jgi:hypothetical protein
MACHPGLTLDAACGHNCAVLRHVRVAVVGLGLLPCFVFSAALPPEHRHDADARHPHATVHQHFASHDHHGTDLAPDDHGHVTWFDRVATQTSLQSFRPVPLVVAHLEDLAVPSRWVAVEALDTAPPHGPPRRIHLVRGPPAFPTFTI